MRRNWGGFRRNYAALKFFIYTFAGSAFLFVALLAVVFLTARANGGKETFNLITLTRLASSLPLADQEWIFIGFAIATRALQTVNQSSQAALLVFLPAAARTRVIASHRLPLRQLVVLKTIRLR